MYKIKTIEDIDLYGKKVLVRVDFNVPIDTRGRITDSTRIDQVIPTINEIRNHNPKSIILMSHFGRPKGKRDPNKSLKHILPYLREKTREQVIFIEDLFASDYIPNGIVLLENLRFYPEEENNDMNFAKRLASFGDVYINEAFSNSHRMHASMVTLPTILPSAGGPLLQKEITTLAKLLKKPKKPITALLGGAKISTKIGLVNSLSYKVDKLVLTGGLANTFLKAQNKTIGRSILQEDYVEVAKEILLNNKVILPEDAVIGFEDVETPIETVLINNVPDMGIIYDVGPKTVAKIKQIIQSSKTIFWNGPLGVFENPAFSKATTEIAHFLSVQIDKVIIVGGGDTVSAINKAGVLKSFSHISTAGGAFLEFLEKNTLPAIQALIKIE